jgi:dihydropyrimidine dehydrogenase (NAD+) subunit PreA
MVDLSLNLAGLELKNPLIVASSDNVRDIRQIKKAEACGASAVVTKAMLPPGSVGLRWMPRFFIDPETDTLCGLSGGKMLAYDQGIDLIKTTKQETQIKIGANLPFHALSECEQCADVARKAAKAGADFIELNFSPQDAGHLGSTLRLEDWQTKEGKEIEIASAIAGDLPNIILQGVKAVKQAINIPVIAKICPEGVDVITMAKAATAGGADAVDAVNVGGGAFKIDIFNRGRLIMPAATNASLGTVGAPLKTFAQGVVARISRAVSIPIIGTGGLMDWKDVVEMMMFGATAVSFCTLLIIHGFGAISGIEKGLKEFLEQQGYRHLDDFRGLALNNIAPSANAFAQITSVARINRQECTGCGTCLKPAQCLAIYMEEEKARVNEQECLGCGTCSLLCPAGAISLVEVPG